MNTRIVFTASCAMLLGGCAAPQRNEPPQSPALARAVSAPERRDPPTPLPEPARELLRPRMVAHARSMTELMNAVAILDYDDAAARANALADEGIIVRSAPGDTAELNAMLPVPFLRLQDEMQAIAALATSAARRQDALALGHQYGRLAESCVACHAMFRPRR